jgi:predicted N-acetyltransferase YhbS
MEICMDEIIYSLEKSLDPDEFVEVLKKSTLAERRPVDDEQRITSMCNNANLIVTARLNGVLIGIARSVTDFVYCTYLSDLAVDVKHQKKGIGKKLIEETKKATPQAKLILLSAPAAIDYYPKIGMKKHNYCYFIDDISDLK